MSDKFIPENASLQPVDKQFISRYRSLEQALSNYDGILIGGITVKDLEGRLRAQGRKNDADMLHMCRETYGFITSNGPGFVNASPHMAQFLGDMLRENSGTACTVESQMMPVLEYGMMPADGTPADAAIVILEKKRGDILILNPDKSLLGIMGMTAVTTALAYNAGGSSIRYLADKGALELPARTIHAGTLLSCAPPASAKSVVIDGNGCCIGVLHPEGSWGY